ncbi:MAG: PilN domain-containing protein [Terriglobales bacterium]|jgi:Tfp pilus assembly protein PilN
MIRINLSPSGQKAKKGKRGAASASSAMDSGEGGSGILLFVVIVLAIVVAANGYWYWRTKNETVRIQAETAKSNVEYARLTQVKQRYQELEKEKESYKKRVDVIDDLRAKQAGPVALMKMIGDTVNRTNEVWLNTLDDDGASINIKGVALSIHGVADLMRNLENTGVFKSVEIKSSYQDESVHDMQAFSFELNCLKQTPQGQDAQRGPAKKS